MSNDNSFKQRFSVGELATVSSARQITCWHTGEKRGFAIELDPKESVAVLEVEIRESYNVLSFEDEKGFRVYRRVKTRPGEEQNPKRMVEVLRILSSAGPVWTYARNLCKIPKSRKAAMTSST